MFLPHVRVFHCLLYYIPRFIDKADFPKLYADYWLKRDKFDFRSLKNERITDANDQFQLFKDLSLPELLSLLVEREKRSFTFIPPINETMTQENTTQTPQQKTKFGLYDSIPCHNLGEIGESDNLDFTEEQTYKLLDMLRWSIQPPHPVIIDEFSESHKTGIKLR